MINRAKQQKNKSQRQGISWFRRDTSNADMSVTSFSAFNKRLHLLLSSTIQMNTVGSQLWINCRALGGIYNRVPWFN